MTAAILAEAPPHVHDDLGGLNGVDRNASFLKIVKKLSAGGAEMFNRMLRIASFLEMLMKAFQYLIPLRLGRCHGCSS